MPVLGAALAVPVFGAALAVLTGGAASGALGLAASGNGSLEADVRNNWLQKRAQKRSSPSAQEHILKVGSINLQKNNKVMMIHDRSVQTWTRSDLPACLPGEGRAHTPGLNVTCIMARTPG